MSATFKKEVLQQLRRHGSDLTKPHEFEFYLYLPTRKFATKAADKIRQSGFSAADVSRSASGDAWLCVAKKTLVPAKADLADHARFFEQIATALGGEFDGWETEIV
jgi:hypothetical protein